MSQVDELAKFLFTVQGHLQTAVDNFDLFYPDMANLREDMLIAWKEVARWWWALMDDQTRFLIAQQVANTKYTADVRPLLELGKAVAGKKPKTFITDGAANFHEAYMDEFWTQNKDTRTEHIRHIRLAGDRNNNRMERFNGEVRQREKVTHTETTGLTNPCQARVPCRMQHSS